MWEIIASKPYGEWFAVLDEESKIDIAAIIMLLMEKGPQLGRPFADKLKGAKTTNLKELRVQSNNHVYRIAFYFDEKRRGLVLTGGDKKGKNEKLFYEKLIREAEDQISLYKNNKLEVIKWNL